MVTKKVASTLIFLCCKFFGGRKNVMVLGGCAVLETFWVVWMEWNRRIFERATCEDVNHLWNRLRYLASLWASVSSECRYRSFHAI